MELIVILLAELIAAPFLAAIAVLAQAIAVIFELLVELVCGALMRRRRAVPVPGPTSPAPPKRWLKRLRWALLGVCAVSLVLAFVLGTFFVPTLVGWIVTGVESRQGMSISYSGVRGNLFLGHVVFEGLQVRRATHDRSTFDLTVAHVDLQMNLWSAFSDPVSLSSLDVRGVRGRFERHSKPDPMRPRRRFVVHELSVEDLELQLVDATVRHGTLDVPVRIAAATSRPLRSDYVLFDALFRSNISGEIAGRPVQVETERDAAGRQTRWRGESLPLALAAHWVAGPFRWIDSGLLDVRVDDRWRREEAIYIDCHWRLTLRDLVARVPPDLGLLKGTAARGVVAWVNRRKKPLEVEFDFTFEEDDFLGRSSLDGTTFVDKLAEAVETTFQKLTAK